MALRCHYEGCARGGGFERGGCGYLLNDPTRRSPQSQSAWVLLFLPMPTGPYETILTTPELAAHLKVSTDTIDRMEKARLLPPPLRSRPLGSGPGRSVVRWDLWTVCRHLDGSAGRTAA